MEGFDQTIETDTITTVSKSLHSSSIENGDEQNEVYPFHAERDGDVRWSAVKNNPSVGLTCWNLLSLLWRERRSIDWMRYIHRILGLMCVSMLNSMLAFLEGLYVNIWLNWTGVIKLADSIPSRPPVFILGHPRTGTTLLHSLMALDSERFYFCNTFQAGFPTCFLFFENLGKRLFAGVLSETRPMDKMKLHFDLPQEDELATCLLTGFRCSPYLSLYFPRNEREFREYQSFRNASRNDVDTWTKAFLKLVNKLKIRDILKLRNEGCDLLKSRQLLLKSPCHTARVRLLLKLFPNAKFVYIHRNPYEVFLSSAHMASTTYGYCFLQKPSDSDLQEYILRQGEILIGEYLSCIDDSTLNETNHVSVSFDDLTSKPEQTMERIYSSLRFDSFEGTSSSYPKTLRRECAKLKSYQKNKFDSTRLGESLIRDIQERWIDHFRRFGYDEYSHNKI